MKHILLFTLLTLSVSFSAFAQTEQGAMFIGGSFQISTASSSEGSSITSFGLGPKFGYFLKDQWAIGSGLGFSVYSDLETSTTFSISPFTRYYFPVVENQFFIFGEGGLNAGSGENGAFFGLNISPGFSFFPTRRWSIELGFSLFDLNFENPPGNDNITSSFSFGVSTFSPSISVNFFF